VNLGGEGNEGGGGTPPEGRPHALGEGIKLKRNAYARPWGEKGIAREGPQNEKMSGEKKRSGKKPAITEGPDHRIPYFEKDKRSPWGKKYTPLPELVKAAAGISE